MRLPGIQYSDQPVRISNAQLPSVDAAGQGLRTAAAFTKQFSQERFEAQEREQRTQFEEIASNFALQEQERMLELQRQRERNPNGFKQDYLESFDKNYESFIPENASEYQKQLFEKNRITLRDSMARNAIQFEGMQKAKMQRERIAMSSDRYINMVQVDANQAVAALNNLKRLHGEGSPEYASARFKVHNAVLLDYIENKKIDDAEEYLKQNSSDFGQNFDNVKATLANAREEIELELKAAEFFEPVAQGEQYGPTRLNPFKTDDLKAANKYFKDMGGYEAVMSLNPNMAQRLVNMADKNFVPDQAKDALEYLYANGDAAQKLYAADTIAKMTEANPAVGKKYFGGDVFEDLSVFNSFLQTAGPEEALESLRKIESLPPDIVSMRSDRADKITGDDKFKVPYRDIAFAAGYDPLGPNFLRGTPEFSKMLKDEVELQYRALFREGYRRYGDEAAAKAYAVSQASKNMEVTYMNGEAEMMPNAPETLLNIGRTEETPNDIVYKYLQQSIKDEGVKDVVFKSDIETQRSLSALQRDPNDPTKNVYGEPYGVKYRVYQKIDINGEMLEVKINNENGNPLYGYIDPENLQDFVNMYDSDEEKQKRSAKRRAITTEAIGKGLSTNLMMGGL